MNEEKKSGGRVTTVGGWVREEVRDMCDRRFTVAGEMVVNENRDMCDRRFTVAVSLAMGVD